MDPNSGQTPNVSPTPSTNQQSTSSTPTAQSIEAQSHTHTYIAIILLVLIYPIGVFYMFWFTKWPRWVKIFVCLPIIISLIAIVAILASVIFIASKPVGQSNSVNTQADNVQRRSDVTQILNAVIRYSNDYGSFPEGITSMPLEIGDGEGQVDICQDLVPKYMPAFPVDPETGEDISECLDYSVGYTIMVDSEGKITVVAPQAKGKNISITR